MNNKHIIFFLLFILIAPVFVSFYLSVEKVRNKKKIVLSLISEEEEPEKEEKSAEKESKKWQKGKYHMANAGFAFHSLNKIVISYFSSAGKVLLPFSERVTPPPKIS